MLIQELLREINAVVGAAVTISGRIVVTGDDRAFLTSGVEAFERRESLPIRDGSRIADHLLRTLPAYVGGPFLYDEECVLTGTIERDSDSFQLCDLRQCKVRRDDLEVEVPVSG
jgi:hypothetical protein